MTYEDPDERDIADAAEGCMAIVVCVLLSILALIGVLAWRMF